MKAITIHQPWASMIALGHKSMETRSWPTRYRGRLCIHAGNCRTPEGGYDLWKQIVDAGLISRDLKLPFGALLGTCELVDVLPTDSAAVQNLLTFHERMLGNFGPGRFAWVLKDFAPFEAPIVMRGRQGLWEYRKL